MGELEKRVCIDGQTLCFEDVVEHVCGGAHIVLCRLATGELRYVSAEEWKAAGPASDDVGEGLTIASERAPVTQRSSLDEKIAFVMSLFRGRSDVYAEGYEKKGSKEGKLGYGPRCRLRWVQGACPKLLDRKAKCADCDHPDYDPLTSEVVRDHCLGRRKGRGRICAVGIYVVDGDICYLLAADFDGPGWQEAASAYRDVCRRHGLSPAVERSRSGNGAHVWVFFDGPVKAALARRLGEGLISEARDNCTAVSFHSYDRLFPLQDSVGEGSLGSLIALPLQGEAVRRGNSVFVDDQFEVYADQCAYLSSLPKADAAFVASQALEFGENPIGLPKGESRKIAPSRIDAEAPRTSPDASCEEVPSAVRVTLADGVRIECKELPPRVVNSLCRIAAFRNPEYSKKLAMHYSVWNIPRVIDLSVLDGDELVLPRGCMDAALATLRDAGTEPFVADGRTDGKRIHARFAGELRETQKPCHDRLVKHDMGVLVAPTGFGKSVIAASVIARHQVNTLIIVPTTALLTQWYESLSQFLQIDDEPPVLRTSTGRKAKHQPGTVGMIGGGKNLRSGIVDVATHGSLFEKGDVAGDYRVKPLVAEYGMVIVDEAQHVGATKLLEVLRAVRSHYVYAMTATPKRDDGLDRILFLECGPLRYEVPVAEQIAEQGMRRLLVPRYSGARPDLEGKPNWHALIDYISSSEDRNHLIATDAVRAMRQGRTPLVLTRRVEHARTLANAIEALAEPLGAAVILLVGGDGAALRRQRLEELYSVPSDKPLCVVATGNYVGEGFDLTRLDLLLLAGPVKFDGKVTQWVGRLHRVGENKSEVIVMDYVDVGIPMFDKEWRARVKSYGKLGYQIAGEGDLRLVGLEGKSVPLGHLFAGKEFASALAMDLADCARRVVVASSWVRLARIKALREELEKAVSRGVSVDVVLKQPSKQTAEWGQVLAALAELGCSVRFARGGEPLDLVVIDDSLVWCGDVAPLAYARKDDCAIRFVSREVAAELTQALSASEDGTSVSEKS